MINNRYLLLDTSLWAQADHLTVTPGRARKASQNPLFGEDMPWEVRHDNLYANVIFDRTDNLYKCWYNPFIIDVATTDTPPAQRERGTYRAALVRAGRAGRQIRKHRGLVRTALVGREIQIIFELRDATLYSFSFSD